MNKVEFFSRHGTVTAVRTFGAGGQRLSGGAPRFEIQCTLLDLRRDGNRATLVRLYELATGTDLYRPSRVADDALVAGIRRAIDAGRLLFVAGGGLSAGPSTGSEAAVSAADLAQGIMGQQAVFTFDGGRYRLVDAATAASYVQMGNYEHVPASETAALLALMVGRAPTTPAEQGLWAQVPSLMADPTGARGRLALLRYVPRAAPPPPDEAPPPTPPPPPTIATQDWIEIQIVYDDGSPFADDCIVVLPGGRETEGPPDGQGMVRMDNIPSGSCMVRFPTLS